MKSVTKILIILCCVSICAGGAALSTKQNAPTDRAKTNVVPVNNRAKHQATWISV